MRAIAGSVATGRGAGALVQAIGAALLWLVGVVAHWVALLPLGAACPCPSSCWLFSRVSLGAGIVATQARKPFRGGFVDLPVMFLYSRPIRGVSFA